MSDKGNTLIICLSSLKGGMELDAIKLAKLLSSKITVCLLCKKDSYIEQLSKDDDAYQVEVIDFSSRLALKLVSMTLIKKVQYVVDKHQITNVIFFGTSELKSLYVVFRKKPHINLILQYVSKINKAKNSWFHQLIYKRVNVHISISAYLKQNIEQTISMAPNAQSLLLYHSFNVDEQAYQQPHHPIKIIHTSRILGARDKGGAEVVDACQLLWDNHIDFRLYLVGEKQGEESIALSRQILSKDYRRHIRSLGYVKDIKHKLPQFDIAIFPTKDEAFGNVFVEGLAAGLVSIAFDNSAIREIADLGFDTHLAKDGDVKDMSEKLLSVCQHIDDEKLKAYNNIANVREVFSPERELAGYLAILR